MSPAALPTGAPQPPPPPTLWATPAAALHSPSAFQLPPWVPPAAVGQQAAMSL